MCIERNHPQLSQRRQCRLLSLSRSTLYYTPVGESAGNLALMALIDRQFMETPLYGSRQMARWLRRQGHAAGRHRVRRLMPTRTDHNSWAHSRIPMEMIFHGRSMRLFQASQQSATMSS